MCPGQIHYSCQLDTILISWTIVPTGGILGWADGVFEISGENIRNHRLRIEMIGIF